MNAIGGGHEMKKVKVLASREDDYSENVFMQEHEKTGISQIPNAHQKKTVFPFKIKSFVRGIFLPGSDDGFLRNDESMFDITSERAKVIEKGNITRIVKSRITETKAHLNELSKVHLPRQTKDFHAKTRNILKTYTSRYHSKLEHTLEKSLAKMKTQVHQEMKTYLTNITEELASLIDDEERKTKKHIDRRARLSLHRLGRSLEEEFTSFVKNKQHLALSQAFNETLSTKNEGIKKYYPVEPEKAAEIPERGHIVLQKENLSHPLDSSLGERKRTIFSRSSIPTYCFSSMFLVDSWKYLVSYGEDESLCYVTGIDDTVHNIKYPHVMLKTKMAHRSLCRVTSDPVDTHRTMTYLDDHGHPVMCLFHKHPGGSIPSPSSLDEKTHRDYEQVYDLIGAIFVETGYIKFFAYTKKFNVDIYGTGVSNVVGHKNVYKIDSAY